MFRSDTNEQVGMLLIPSFCFAQPDVSRACLRMAAGSVPAKHYTKQHSVFHSGSGRAARNSFFSSDRWMNSEHPCGVSLDTLLPLPFHPDQWQECYCSASAQTFQDHVSCCGFGLQECVHTWALVRLANRDNSGEL